MMDEKQAGGYAPKHTYVVIMAGGVGSRFWPASRDEMPKQFLDILGVGKSLLQLTCERFRRLVPVDHIMVVTHARYRDLVSAQLPDLPGANILCEPSRNNTAPCVAYASFKLMAVDPEANVVVAPSDHLILNEEAFLEQIKRALAFSAEHDALLTLGIQPTRPDTGYGYIQFDRESVAGHADVHKVRRFTEKPPLEKAKAFLASGAYLWNAGIFVWRAGSVLEAFQRHARTIHDILAPGIPYYNTEDEQAFIDAAYPSTPSLSVDYAIMEKADNIYTVPSSFGWSDLGTWKSLYEQLTKDEAGNARQGERILAIDSSDNLIRSRPERALILGGLQDFIVVDEEDVLLIWPKSREQEIKQVSAEAKRRFS